MRAFLGTGSALVLSAVLLLAQEQNRSSTEGTSATEESQPQKIIIPESSRVKPRDKGKRAHTNYQIRDTRGPIAPPKPVTTGPGE
jgi:hypothetical protein